MHEINPCRQIPCHHHWIERILYSNSLNVVTQMPLVMHELCALKTLPVKKALLARLRAFVGALSRLFWGVEAIALPTCMGWC